MVKKDKNFITEKYPNTIKIYNQFIKGVDKSNQLKSFYEQNRTIFKW